MVLPAAGDGLSLDAMALAMPHKRPIASSATDTAASSRPLDACASNSHVRSFRSPNGQTVPVSPTKARTPQPGQPNAAMLYSAP